VEEDDEGRPLALTLRRRRVGVAFIEDMWEVDEEWWRERPVSRMYYQVTTEDSRRIVIFRDLVDGGWHRQRV
jgi:hypothetical protein